MNAKEKIRVHIQIEAENRRKAEEWKQQNQQQEEKKGETAA